MSISVETLLLALVLAGAGLFAYRFVSAIIKSVLQKRRDLVDTIRHLSQCITTLQSILAEDLASVKKNSELLSETCAVTQKMVVTLERPVKAIEDMPKMLIGLVDVCQAMAAQHEKLNTLLLRQPEPKPEDRPQPFDKIALSPGSEDDMAKMWEILRLAQEKGLTAEEAADLYASERSPVTVNPSAITAD